MTHSTLPETERRMQIIRLWDAMFRGARAEAERRGFIGVHNAPEIVSVTGACENVDTLFKVDYFGEQAYLAQSDQLYLELITPHLEKVYAEIQSFRMEPEADDRHLTQFSLFEIEHQGDLGELMNNIEAILWTMLDYVITGDALYAIEPEWVDKLTQYARDGLARVTYTEAVEYLKDNHFPDLEWGDDLKAHHEAEIVNEFGPCFVTHYPLPIKFFNMKQNDINPAVVNSCDLLLPFSGESAGAAEREHTYEKIEKRLKESDMYHRLIELGGKDEDFEWYLEAHRDKDIPLHSGAGIGMARVAQFLLGVEDIREAVPFLMNSENLL